MPALRHPIRALPVVLSFASAGACLPGVILEPPAVAPPKGLAPVDTLVVSGATTRSFDYRFTSIDDDGAALARYEIFVDTESVGDARIDGLTPAATIADPPAKGVAVTGTIDGLASHTQYFVAVRATATRGPTSLSADAEITTVESLCGLDGVVTGDIALARDTSAARVAGLVGCTRISGDLTVTDPDLQSLSLPDLTAIDGALIVDGAVALATLSLPALTQAGRIDLQDQSASSALAALDLSSLTATAGPTGPNSDIGISIGFPRVITPPPPPPAPGPEFPHLSTLSLPSMQSQDSMNIGQTALTAIVWRTGGPLHVGTLVIQNNGSLQALAFPSFTSSALTISGNGSLAALSFGPATQLVGNVFIEANPKLTLCAILLALDPQVTLGPPPFQLRVFGVSRTALQGQPPPPGVVLPPAYDPNDPEAARGALCLDSDVLVADGIDPTIFASTQVITGVIEASDLATQTTLSFDSLYWAGGLVAARDAALSSLAAPALARVGMPTVAGGLPVTPVGADAFVVADDPALVTLDAPALNRVTTTAPGARGVVNVYRCPLLSSCGFAPSIAALAPLAANNNVVWSVFDIQTPPGDASCGYASTPTTGCSIDVVCATDVCGNGTVDSAPTAEACDDGNHLRGDGCDATCACEPSPFVVDAATLDLWHFDVPSPPFADAVAPGPALLATSPQCATGATSSGADAALGLGVNFTRCGTPANLRAGLAADESGRTLTTPTVEVWVRFSGGTGSGGTVFSLAGPSGELLRLDVDDAGTFTATGGASQAHLAQSFVDSAYHRVGVRCDASGLTLVVQGGVAVASAPPCDAFDGVTPVALSTFALSGGGAGFDGAVDDVRIVDAAIDDAALGSLCR